MTVDEALFRADALQRACSAGSSKTVPIEEALLTLAAEVRRLREELALTKKNVEFLVNFPNG